VRVTGVEGDYDGGEVSPQRAIELLEGYGLRATIYTSWSHTDERPRWRVLAPLSAPIAPSARLRYVEVLNGMLDGILAHESATLSQCYYVGHPVGGATQVIHTFDDPAEGFCLDEIEDLDALRVPFKTKEHANDPGASSGTQDDYLAGLLQGDDIHGNALRIVGRMVRDGLNDAAIHAVFSVLAEKVAEQRGAARTEFLLNGELGRMIKGARVKGYGQSEAREHQKSQESQTTQAENWPEPEPLRAPLPDSEPYPVEALGAMLAPAVHSLHYSIKAPIELCAQSALASASYATQAHYDVQMPWGEVKPTSLDLLTVAVSGERKSGVDDLVLGAAKAQERAEMTVYASAQRDHEAEMFAWRSAMDSAKTSAKGKGKGTAADFREAFDAVGPEPVGPVIPLRFVTDPVEGLYKLLAIGQPSVALFSDEGGLLIGGHALNNDNALKTLARWCKLWDGSPFDRVRAGDGSGILYGRRMAMHQLAQPDVMTVLLSDSMANGQGFLARCLVVWPQSTIGTRQIAAYEWAGDRPDVKRLFAVLKGLIETPPRCKDDHGQELDPIALKLDADASALAVAAGNEFEGLMAPGRPLSEIADRASKAMDNALRIAAVLAVMDSGMATRTIQRGHLERSLVLMQWYLGEALRIRGAVAIPQEVADAESLLAWLKERGLRNFRSVQVLQRGPAQLRNKARLMAAIKELETSGYLRPNEPGTEVDGVKARLSWEVNPDVL